METSRDFAQIRLNETLKELQDVRQKLREVSDRLASAENALRFYADPRNYGIVREEDTPKMVWQDRLKGDYQTIRSDLKIAGERARDHFVKLSD